MKKFTKILARRRAKDSSSGSSKSEPAPSRLYEAPCFHQLSSSRLVHGGRPTRAPAPSSSRLVADEIPELTCPTCAGINFPSLLDWRPGQPRPWIGLSHVLDHDGEPGCPYCAFFRALLGVRSEPGGPGDLGHEANGSGGGKFAPYLRIRLAFERLGVREKHELGAAVLIEVMARNKSLPWGYVVKAAEDEGASMAGYLGNERVVGIRGRTVTPLLDPALARTWVKFCQDHHSEAPSCGRTTEPLVEGLRLVDVEERRIVSAGDLDTNGSDYATLSYVWGEGEWGGELGEDGSLPKDIPPLIADAVDFAKSLGFRYIWIDRYCFFQLPDDVRQRQRDLMGDIFSQSSLTLVVAAGDGVNDGIPGVSVPRDPQLSLKTASGLFITSLLRPDLEVASSTWASRAWTYQEGLFSRRRLVFTPTQAYFQCGSLHCHESLSIPLQLSADLNLGRVFPETGPGTQPDDLKNHIKTYMGKQHTRPQDRLDAFRGLLHHYNRMDRPVDSFLGLPLFHPHAFSSSASSNRAVSQTDRLAVALAWLPTPARPSHTTTTTTTTTTTAPSTPYLLDPPARRASPSWTWLAWHPRLARDSAAAPQHSLFQLSLGPEAGRGGDVCAPPGMGVSVGFDDGEVLGCWGVDGEATGGRREEAVRFLRVRSYIFDMVARREGDGVSLTGVGLGAAQREAVEEWFRAARLDNGESPVPDGEYQLTGVLVSGRNWRGTGAKEATVLVFRREDWKRIQDIERQEKEPEEKEQEKTGEEKGDEGKKNGDEEVEEKKEQEEVAETRENKEKSDKGEGRLVRFGALTLSFAEFKIVDNKSAVIEGVSLESSNKGDVKVELREVDIY
ncbi:hypothetical protein ACO1O0_008899 [Amphichorda felina]